MRRLLGPTLERQRAKSTFRAGAGGGFRLDLPTTLSCKRGAGTTIWALGTIHRGDLAPRYWSSPGAMYHHIYPVGYRATKTHFGRDYAMEIEQGIAGPVFKVTDVGAGRTFAGPTPTKPWTDVCLSLNTGARISGPLFFGFSDPAVQLAIAGMYTPEERAAALGGRSWKPPADGRATPATPPPPSGGEVPARPRALPPGPLEFSRDQERAVARVYLVPAH